MKKKWKLGYCFFTVAFVIALGIGLTGCDNKKVETNINPTDIPAENTAIAPVETREPAMGGEITVGIAQDIDDNLDPHKLTGAGSREVVFNIFEGLLKPNSDGYLIPAVAESYAVSEDGSVFTFVLREHVLFHNGKPVTSADVVYSLTRCMGADGNPPLIKAFGAIQSVEAIDEKTVVITLKNPDVEFPAHLTAAIIPADYDMQDTAPIGTGPFRFVSRSIQENIVLEKFADYWGNPAYLDKVIFKIIENADALMMSIKSGAVDFGVHIPVAQTKSLTGEGFIILEGSMNIVQALYLNHNVKPLNDLKVRQALNYAVDIDSILALTADGKGTPVGSSMYPAFKKYFMPELADAYPYDPEKAKSLLKEAGYPNGFDLTITVPSNYSQHVDTAQVLAEQYKAIGVNVTIKPIEWASWLTDVYTNHDYESTVVGFDASTLTGRAMLERWKSTNAKNLISFSNAEYDAALESAFSAKTEEDQIKSYKRAEAILSEQAANVYLQAPYDLAVMNSKIGGYVFYPLYVMDLSKLHFWK